MTKRSTAALEREAYAILKEAAALREHAVELHRRVQAGTTTASPETQELFADAARFIGLALTMSAKAERMLARARAADSG